jgi:hypothetical protein
VPFPALDCCPGKATPGLPCQVSTKGLSLIPILELESNSVEGIHPPSMCISISQGGHKVCQTLEPLVNSMACRLGSAPPLVDGWEGDDQVNQKGRAELGDGLAAPVVTGKGAIVPWQPCGVAPVGGCGRPANGVHSPPCLRRAQSGEGNAIPLPCFQRALIGEGNAMALMPQRIWAKVPSIYPSGLMVDQALELWAAEPTTLPPPLFVDSGWGAGNPMAFKDLPTALHSPL